MARARDYRAEYAARIARAKSHGLSVAQATGHAKRAKAPSVTELREAGKLPPAPKPFNIRGSKAPKVVDLPQLGTRIVTTNDKRLMYTELRAAQRRGDKVAIQVTYSDANGRPVTITIGDRSGNRPAGGAARPEPGDTTRRHGKVKLVMSSNPAVTKGGGADVAAILAAVDDGEDFDDVLYEAWLDQWDDDGT